MFYDIRHQIGITNSFTIWQSFPIKLFEHGQILFRSVGGQIFNFFLNFLTFRAIFIFCIFLQIFNFNLIFRIIGIRFYITFSLMSSNIYTIPTTIITVIIYMVTTLSSFVHILHVSYMCLLMSSFYRLFKVFSIHTSVFKEIDIIY